MVMEVIRLMTGAVLYTYVEPRWFSNDSQNNISSSSRLNGSLKTHASARFTVLDKCRLSGLTLSQIFYSSIHALLHYENLGVSVMDCAEWQIISTIKGGKDKKDWQP